MSNGDGSQLRVDYTSKDYASLRESLLEVATERLPEWTDHSPNDLGVLLVELFSYMGDIVLHHQDRLASESYLSTAIERRSAVDLLRLVGDELRPPRPASADLTLLFDPAHADPITIPQGATFQAKLPGETEPVTFRFEREDLTVVPSTLPVFRASDGTQFRKLEPLPVVQVDVVVEAEVVGSSDGSASQRFKLARRPLVDGTLELRVDEGAGPRLWEQRDTLLLSVADDRHYLGVRDGNDDAWIEFGDGRHGRIPARGRNNVTADYRTGGGVHGNVPAQSITKSVVQIDGLKQVVNTEQASGGQDSETAAEAAARAPRLFRAMGRAVTAGGHQAAPPPLRPREGRAP